METTIKFKIIPTYKAIKEIYKHKKTWGFLYDAVEYSNEVFEEDDEIYFNYSHDKLYYINEEDYFWVAGYDNGKLAFLQFINYANESHFDLVIAQKKSSIKTKDYFGNLINWLSNTFSVKYLTTFPMNDHLKEYYINHGFREYKKELRLDFDGRKD